MIPLAKHREIKRFWNDRSVQVFADGTRTGHGLPRTGWRVTYSLLSLSRRHLSLLELVFLPSLINLGICVLIDPSKGLPDASPRPRNAASHLLCRISAVD